MIALVLALLAADPTIAGVVKDATGKPVAGAEVALSAWTIDKEAATRTDGAGRFSMPLPPTLAANPGTGAAVAFHPKHGFAVKQLYNCDPGDCAIQFDKLVGVRIPIQDADGKPLKNALSSAVSIHHEYVTPKSLLAHASTKTNDQGIAEFALLNQELVSRLTVETSPGVTQSFRAAAGLQDWRSVRLSPMTQVKGRFVGSPLPKGSEIVIESNSPTNKTGMRLVRVESRVKIGDDGAFNGMAIAEGQWSPKIDHDDLWVVEEAQAVSADTNEVMWTLKPTTPVVGVVCTTDGAPVPHALVSFYTPTSDIRRMFTDEHGRYSGRVPQGKLIRSAWVSSEFEMDRRLTSVVEIPTEAETFEVPPIVVARSAAISGVVTDETGKPATGVRVMAVCRVGEAGGSMTSYLSTKSGADGTFRLVGVSKNAAVTLHAFHPMRGVYASEVSAKPQDTGVTLKLNPAASVNLAVTATDEAGKPVEQVELRVDVRANDLDRAYWLRRLRTDFESPTYGTGEKTISLGSAPKELSYQVAARAEGFAAATTPWIPGADLGSPIALKLRRVAQFAGRVVDSAGKPIPGVVVKPAGVYRSDASSTTDSDGRFELTGFPSRSAVVTAHKSGWRYGGAVMTAASPATITLKRPNEPAPRVMAAVFPKAKETAEIAKRLSDPLADAIFKGKSSKKPWWAQTYAYHNPARMLELIDGPQWTAEDRDFCRYHLAAAFAATDVDEAAAQAHAIGESGQKASALLAIAKRLPDSAKNRRRPLLADALTAARGSTDPALKTIFIALIGEALMNEGDANGEKAIREAQSLAVKLPQDGWSAYAVGSTAEPLALIDFPAAMKLTKSLPGHAGEAFGKGAGGSDSYTFNRHRGNIAHKIAGKQPANAETAFNSLTDATRKEGYAPRVCYRMAPVDLPRAKRIAAVVREPADRAVCLSSMAMALGPQRKADALPMLREAFKELAAANTRSEYGQGPLALALLGYVAAVAPDDVDDFFWMSLAIPASNERASIPAMEKGARWGGMGIASLLSQRFADEVAVAFAASLRDELATIVGDLSDNRGHDDPTVLALAALLATHPDAASDAITRWPAPKESGDPQIAADRARLSLHSILSASPQRRNESILERHLHHWIIDKEDF